MADPIHAQSPEFITACGGRLDNPANYASADYQGRLYFFCTRACLLAFEQDPDAFMAGEVQHPVEHS